VKVLNIELVRRKIQFKLGIVFEGDLAPPIGVPEITLEIADHSGFAVLQISAVRKTSPRFQAAISRRSHIGPPCT